LLSIAEKKFDFFEEAKKEFGKVEFVVPVQVIREIKKLKEKGKKYKESTGIAERLIKINKAKIIRSREKGADEALIELGKKGAIVASNDREIKKKLKKLKCRIIFLKQGKLLEME